jgi:F420-0:gamma-glutamyl ligase
VPCVCHFATPEVVQVLKEFVARRVALIILSAGIDTSNVPGEVLTERERV